MALLSLILLISHLAPVPVSTEAPLTWYGPAKATFEVQFAGNPFDPAENDLRVRFSDGKGHDYERLAFYDAGTFAAILVAPTPGTYTATLIRNGKVLEEEPREHAVVVTNPLPRGFIRVDPVLKNRFNWDSGEAYVPLGMNLAWQSPNIPDLKDMLGKMGANGMNWSRIWANVWDGKNPWWSNSKDDSVKDGELWTPALDRWAELVPAAERAGVSFQFTLFHHGEFSTRVDPNWPDHPWNTAKGGFLKNPADFFTDPEANRRTKLMLRYMVARFAASPSILAWELFNEVESVDAVHDGRWADVESWHGEMATYLRSIDPYHHLITTSSNVGQTGLWSQMDYYQGHSYTPSPLNAISGFGFPRDKPAFVGEFGRDPYDQATEREEIRDGALAGIMTGQAGAGQYWYWDRVDQHNLYGEFAKVANVLKTADLGHHRLARPLAVTLAGPLGADIEVRPGVGWGNAGRVSFVVPADLTPTAFAGIPAYFQSQTGDHKAMMPMPLSFQLPNFSGAGEVRVELNEASTGGGRIWIAVDGKRVAQSVMAHVDKSKVITAPFPRQTHQIQVGNDGVDWVRLSKVVITGVGPVGSAMGFGDGNMAMVRVRASRAFEGTLRNTGLVHGPYALTTFDMVTGESAVSTVQIPESGLIPVKFASLDTVLVFRQK